MEQNQDGEPVELVGRLHIEPDSRSDSFGLSTRARIGILILVVLVMVVSLLVILSNVFRVT